MGLSYKKSKQATAVSRFIVSLVKGEGATADLASGSGKGEGNEG